ncbi:MAG: metallophosphoesterase [Limosilactobacillus sp.]|uniref:metallophosphoesterase n=1 Tax=Limosilactobacillus sp. TaxID=2773925 RepID=UPI002704044B|nr:metallophosphoesterase [Limosilactobacillus sp.]
MTKALIISDNHGDRQVLEDIVAKWADKVDVMIHCGDSEFPADDPLMQNFVRVAGNNDWNLGYDNDQETTVGGTHFFVTHGHHYQVNFTMTPLMLKGQSVAADVVCFGHTHQLMATVEKGMLLINPGSISLPRGQYAPIGGTFAIVDADADRFVVDFYNRQSQAQADLHLELNRK